MRTQWKRALAGLVLALLTLAPEAGAQRHEASAGYGGGYFWSSPLNGGSGPDEVKLESGWVVNAHAEQWMLARRVGVRASGAWTERPLSFGSGAERDISTVLAEASLLLRPLPANPERTVAPFVGVGGGVAYYHLGEGEPFHLGNAGVAYDGEADLLPALSLTAGVDILPRWRWNEVGVRLEWTDVVALDSPFEGTGGDLDPIHNQRLSLSLTGWFSWLR